MGLIQRQLEAAAAIRESSDLGGTLTLATGEEIPCSIGVDTSGMQRADNSAGVIIVQSRRILVRTSELAGVSRQPQSGDTVTVQGNLESSATSLVISPGNGIEQFNAILTAFNLYNPSA